MLVSTVHYTYPPGALPLVSNTNLATLGTGRGSLLDDDKKCNRRNFLGAVAGLAAGVAGCSVRGSPPPLLAKLENDRESIESALSENYPEGVDMRRLDRIPFYYNDTAIAGEWAVNAMSDQTDAHDIYESLLGGLPGLSLGNDPHHMSGSHIYELVENKSVHFELLSPQPKPPGLGTPLQYISEDIERHVSEALSRWNVDVSLDHRQEKYAVSPNDILTDETDKEMMKSLVSEHTGPDSSVSVFFVDTDRTSDAGEYFRRKASAYVRVPNREPERLEPRVEHELGHSLNLKHNTYPKGIWRSRRGALRTEMLVKGDVSLEIEENVLKQKIHSKEIDQGRLESEHVESARNLLRVCEVDEEEELELSYEYSYAEATNPGFEDALRMKPVDSADQYHLMLELGESEYNLFLHPDVY